MIDRSKAFVVRAGKIIFGMSIVLWFMARYPVAEMDTTHRRAANRGRGHLFCPCRQPRGIRHAAADGGNNGR